MSRSRRKRTNPVDARRRTIALKTLGLGLLLVIVAVLVFKALAMP